MDNILKPTVPGSFFIYCQESSEVFKSLFGDYPRYKIGGVYKKVCILQIWNYRTIEFIFEVIYK